MIYEAQPSNGQDFSKYHQTLIIIDPNFMFYKDLSNQTWSFQTSPLEK